MSGLKIIELDDNNTCKICDNALAKYSCPKCNIRYCSVTCYRSEQHLECSEEFYKNCVSEELLLEDNTEAKQRILDILERNRFDNDEDDALDSDDDSDFEDISRRLAGVDLDNAEDVWEKLTEDEKQEFVSFLKSEEVTKFIPSWTPWWLYCAKSVEDVGECDKFKEQCPAIVDVKNFREISKKEAASCVRYNLINVLGAYAFATRYFNGDYRDFSEEAVTCIVTISLVLRENQNFEDFDSSVKSIEFECTQSDWIVADVENFKLLREDLQKILHGPNSSDPKFYILSALSDLKLLLNLPPPQKSKIEKDSFKKAFPNNHFPTVKVQSKNKIKNCVRKLDYLLSYAKDCFTL